MEDTTLQGTLSPKANQAETDAARRRRESLRKGIISLSGRGFDDSVIRQKAYEKGGYDIGEIDSILGEYKQLIDSNFSSSVAPPKIKTPDLSKGSAVERQSIADIDTTIKMSNEAIDLLNGVSTGPLAGRTQGAKQMLPGGGNEKFNKLDAQLSNIKANFMKSISGAAVSDQEVKRLSQFLPSTNDQEEVIKLKLEALKSELRIKKENTYRTLGIDPNSIQGEEEQVAEVQLSRQDQESSGQLVNPDTGEIKSSGFFETPKEDFLTKAGKVGKTLGVFFGGNKIGEALGNVIGGQMAKYGEAGEIFKDTIASIEKMYQEGRIDEEKRNRLLDIQEQGAKEAFGYNGPEFKQLTGDAVSIAMNFVPMAKAAKGASLVTKTLVAGGNLAKAAVAGSAKATAEGQDITSGAGTTAAGYAAVTSLGKGLGTLGKLFGFVSKKGGAALSGLGDDVVEEIIANPKLARVGMKGNYAETIKNNAKESIGVLDKFIKNYSAEYSKSMDSLSDLKIDNEKVKKSLVSKAKNLLKSRGVAETKKGLDFAKSRFIEPGDEKRISIAFQEIQKANNMSPKSLNTLRQRISELRKSNSDDNKVFNRVIDDMLGSIRKEIEGMGSEVSNINKTYSDKIDLAQAFRRELGNIGSTKKISRADLIDAEKRIGKLFITDKEAVRELFREIGAGDVIGKQAGTEVNAVGSGQSAKISDAAMGALRASGLPKLVGYGAAAAGDIKRITEKLTKGQGLDDVERRLLTRVLSSIGQ